MLLLLLFALNVFGQAGPAPVGSLPYNVNLLLQFESGSSGDPVTAAYMNANDTGTPPNKWTLNGATGTISKASTRDLGTPVVVDRKTYTSAGGTRSYECPLADDGDVQFEFSGRPYNNECIIAGWFKSTMPKPDARDGTYDILKMENSGVGGPEWAVMQMRAWNVKAHSSKGTGPNIPIDRDTWYWCVLHYKKRDGAYLWVYDTSGSLVGKSFCAFGASTEGVRFVQIGNVNPHGIFPSGSFFFDNVVFKWGNTVTAPIGP